MREAVLFTRVNGVNQRYTYTGRDLSIATGVVTLFQQIDGADQDTPIPIGDLRELLLLSDDEELIATLQEAGSPGIQEEALAEWVEELPGPYVALEDEGDELLVYLTRPKEMTLELLAPPEVEPNGSCVDDDVDEVPLYKLKQAANAQKQARQPKGYDVWPELSMVREFRPEDPRWIRVILRVMLSFTDRNNTFPQSVDVRDFFLSKEPMRHYLERRVVTSAVMAGHFTPARNLGFITRFDDRCYHVTPTGRRFLEEAPTYREVPGLSPEALFETYFLDLEEVQQFKISDEFCLRSFLRLVQLADAHPNTLTTAIDLLWLLRESSSFSGVVDESLESAKVQAWLVTCVKKGFLVSEKMFDIDQWYIRTKFHLTEKGMAIAQQAHCD